MSENYICINTHIIITTMINFISNVVGSYVGHYQKYPVRKLDLAGGCRIGILPALFGVGIAVVNYSNIDKNKFSIESPNDQLLQSNLKGMSVIKGAIYGSYPITSLLFMAYDIMFKDQKSFSRHFIPGSVHHNFMNKSNDNCTDCSADINSHDEYSHMSFAEI